MLRCVPLNAFGATAELEADLQLAGVHLVISLHPDHSSDVSIHQLASKVGIPCWGLIPDGKRAGIFTLVPNATHAVQPIPQRTGNEHTGANSLITATSEADRSAGDVIYSNDLNFGDPMPAESLLLPNQHMDEVLVLFTSGTTGSKKLVPHLLADVLVATACISVSWNLTEKDTNCNLMPLFHVGGIIRQVFSPILSGGAVICCPHPAPCSS
jgi:acyl-coenzyme A synthetase/AMP-(fatty) acid ligase